MERRDFYDLVYKNNYHHLYRIIQNYEANPDMTWEDAMENSAILLSEEVNRLTAEIIRIYETNTRINNATKIL